MIIISWQSSVVMAATGTAMLLLYQRVVLPSVMLQVPVLHSAAFLGCWASFSAIAVLFLRNMIVVPVFLLPSILVGKLSKREELVAAFLSRPGNNAQRVTIPSNDIYLDGCVIRQQTLNPEAEKWVVWFNANGVIYEQNLEFLAEYSNSVGASVLTFNYRGVGSSTGWPFNSRMLGQDGHAALQFIIENYGAKENNIVLHGHSLGAGVLNVVHKEYPKAKMVHDRSFSTLSTEVAVMMARGLNVFMGCFLGFALGTTAAIVHWFTDPSISPYLSGWTAIPLGIVLGYFMANQGLIDLLAPRMIQTVFDWEMDAISEFNVKKTFVIASQHDEVIPYEGASLHQLLTHEGVAFHGTLLSRHPQFNHMAPLSAFHEWGSIVENVRKLFEVEG